MFLSVVIPTFNRSEILKKTLEALLNQTLPEQAFEVIIMDDGSTDNTKEIVEILQQKSSSIHYFYQKNQGQGIARNTAIKYAKGDVIVLIGDDIIVASDFLNQHLIHHANHPKENEAVLGFTDWHPDLEITPFMRWLTNGSTVFGRFGGHQFAYEKLKGLSEADFNFFYTSNISLKRSLLEKYPFDVTFSAYGWEDIELGYRLTKSENLRLYYNENAKGYHYHIMKEESLAKRMRDIGRSAWIFHRKYPELKKVPDKSKKFIFSILANPVFLSFFKLVNKNFYFYAASKKYFLEGLALGEKDIL